MWQDDLEYNEDGDKVSRRPKGSSGTTCYKHVNWSRSMSEEVIGVLWLIVAILAYGVEVRWLMWGAGIKAATDQLFSVYFAIKEVMEKKHELSSIKSL